PNLGLPTCRHSRAQTRSAAATRPDRSTTARSRSNVPASAERNVAGGTALCLVRSLRDMPCTETHLRRRYCTLLTLPASPLFPRPVGGRRVPENGPACRIVIPVVQAPPCADCFSATAPLAT